MEFEKKQKKTSQTQKNTPKYLQQFKLLFFQPSHLRFTFCRTVNTLSAETKALCYGTRPFGRWGRHEFSVRIEVVFPRLFLRSCCTSVNELKQHLLRDWILDAVAYSCEQKHILKLINPFLVFGTSVISSPLCKINNVIWLKYTALNEDFHKMVVSGIKCLCFAPQRAKQSSGPLPHGNLSF